jgi:hypothetical protein
MTSKVGVLEWVKNNNVSAIKNLISEEMTKIQKFVKENPQSLENNGKSINLMKIKAFDLRNKWIKSNAASDYHQMYIK